MSEENFYTLINKIATEIGERVADKICMFIENKLNNSAPISSKNKFFTVKDFAKKHKYPSVHALRWYIFNEKLNGFDRVIKRIGRRVLINEEKFFEWIEENPTIDWDKAKKR